MNNGLTSGFFSPQRGVRQGCCLSPTLFILVVELLAVNIRSNSDIRGIPMRDEELKLSQFADDLTCFLRDEDSLLALLTTLDSFADYSGLCINKEKSQILCPSSSIHKNREVIQDIPVTRVAKILGISFKAKASVNDQYLLNFKKPLSKICQVCSSWSCRQLSIKGKITIANTLLVSLLQYPCSVIQTPAIVISEYQKLISSFIWDGKRPKIAFKTLILPIESGGLRLMDLRTRLQVIRLQWIKRTVMKTQSHSSRFLRYLTGADSLFGFFASKPSINLSWLPRSKFYSELYRSWNEFHSFPPSSESDIRGERLWNNQWITSSGASLYWRSWEEQGISRISDICHEAEPRTLSHKEIAEKFDVQCSFLDSLMLRLSIPSHWRNSLSAGWSDFDQLPPGLEVRFPSGTRRDLLSLTAKKIYRLLIDVKDPACTAFSRWSEGVDGITMTSREQWSEACMGVYRATRETKLQSFHFKVLHRTIPCNVYLKQLRIKPSDWCHCCDESDTIVHFFYRCAKVRPFWKAVCVWFRDADDLYLDKLCASEFIWGLPAPAHRAPLINAITLHVKYYIFRQRLFHDSDLNLLHWLLEFRTKLESEKWICRKLGQGGHFNRWQRIYEALQS